MEHKKGAEWSIYLKIKQVEETPIKKIESLIPNKFMSLANIKEKDHGDHNKKNKPWKRYRS